MSSGKVFHSVVSGHAIACTGTYSQVSKAQYSSGTHQISSPLLPSMNDCNMENNPLLLLFFNHIVL